MSEMHKVRRLRGGGYAFFCPGCDRVHAVNTCLGVRWTYNNDPAKPTFTPSILVTLEGPNWKDICHSFVTNGTIQFLSDCTHRLAGKTLDVPDWPYAPGSYGGVDEDWP